MSTGSIVGHRRQSSGGHSAGSERGLPPPAPRIMANDAEVAEFMEAMQESTHGGRHESESGQHGLVFMTQTKGLSQNWVSTNWSCMRRTMGLKPFGIYIILLSTHSAE